MLFYQTIIIVTALTQLFRQTLSLSMTQTPKIVSVAAGTCVQPSLPNKALVLYRYKLWWIRPKHISKVSDMPDATLLLLYRDGPNSYRIVIPEAPSYLKANGVVDLLSPGSCETCRYCTGSSSDPFSLISSAVSKLVPTSATSMSPPAQSDRLGMFCGLGWATWNTFYTNLNQDNIMSALQTLNSALAPSLINWVLVDDGWQHTDVSSTTDGSQWGGKLLSTSPDPAKFPSSTLPTLISDLKTQGVSKVFAWHALSGYWTGLAQSLGSSYPSLQSRSPEFPPSLIANDPTLLDELSIPNKFTSPQTQHDCDSFYADYHASILNQGFDGVKVDAQAVANINPHPSATFLHRSLQQSVASRFGGAIIHCMCHDPAILYLIRELYCRCPNLPLVRASDDYYPTNEPSHGCHITDCAFNSLLISHVGVCDWDMFASNGDYAAFHGMSRAISGGPIYISDDIAKGMPNAALLTKVVGPDFRYTYPPLSSLLPTRESLFQSYDDTELLRLWNVNSISGVLFVANVHGVTWGQDGGYVQTGERKTLTSDISFDMIEIFRESPSDTEFIAWFSEREEALMMKSGDATPITLEWMKSEVITIAPFVDGLAVLGFVDMYNAGGPVKGYDSDSKTIALKRGISGRLVVALTRKNEHISSWPLVEARSQKDGKKLTASKMESSDDTGELFALYSIQIPTSCEALTLKIH